MSALSVRDFRALFATHCCEPLPLIIGGSRSPRPRLLF
jgi:hypothetical protein